MILDQTAEIKIVIISIYEGFRKLNSELYKNIAHIYTRIPIYVVSITLPDNFRFCAKGHNSPEPRRFTCLCRRYESRIRNYPIFCIKF